MRASLLALAILASPAIAADFRGSELGSSCAAISEREEALGSKPISPNQPDPHWYRFKGRAFGRDVYIIYLCREGVLSIGNYDFPKHNYDDAVSEFQFAYRDLSSTYGTPFLEGPTEPKDWGDKEFPRVGAAEPREYTASWSGPGFHAHVALMLDGDRAGRNWHVLVVVSRDKGK